jgi:4-hydroxyphenylpyruvate dioxygenase-like putative hemolysin
MSKFFGDGKVFHIAFVVRDLDRAVDQMLASGIGPFYFAKGLNLKSRYRGRRQDLEISVAFGCTGSMLFELVAQDNDVPSAYKEYLQRHPDGGLHHIAYFCDDFDEALKEAASRGTEFDVVQEFLDANEKTVEMYIEPKGVKDPMFIQILLPSRFDEGFEGMPRIAATWDGTQPKRNLFDLFPAEPRVSLEPVV